jgi:hypothetical protein
MPSSAEDRVLKRAGNLRLLLIVVFLLKIHWRSAFFLLMHLVKNYQHTHLRRWVIPKKMMLLIRLLRCRSDVRVISSVIVCNLL